MLDKSMQMEQFSEAYFRAVVFTAGYNLQDPAVDEESIDWTIRDGVRSQIDVQLKCTAQKRILKEDALMFPLKVKNYNELIDANTLCPRILVVVFVPEDASEWLYQDEERLAIRHCAYWISLQGNPPSSNKHTVTVEIPRSRVFSVNALHELMARARGREWL